MREPPHGLAYIAAMLRAEGYRVEAIDAKQRRLKTQQVVKEALERGPDMVGLTAMTPDVIWAGKIAEGIKAALPDVPMVIGGPHANALPEETLEEFGGFDVAVVGEGEFTSLELAQSVEERVFPGRLPEIRGIAYRSKGEVVITEPRGYLVDLDSLAFPAWDLFPAAHNRSYPIYATRGCPFGCKFCQRVLGDKVRRRSIENIIAELEWLLDTFNARGFWFADETFGFNHRWTSDLLDLMIQRDIRHRALWHAQTRVDLITEKLLSKMKEAGCDGLGFGVESGSQEILQKTGKNIKLKDAPKAVTLAKKIGIKTRSFFILGHPYETIKTIRETIDFAARLNTDFVSFAVMVPYPGTEVWDLANRKEAGYSYVSQNWDDYRKHLAAPLGFNSIPHQVLMNLDKKAYIIFYGRNRRWCDLLAFLWEHRSSIRAHISNQIQSFPSRILPNMFSKKASPAPSEN